MFLWKLNFCGKKIVIVCMGRIKHIAQKTDTFTYQVVLKVIP